MANRLLFFLTLCFPLFASSQVQVGFFAGPQGTTAKYTVRSKLQETESKMGYQLGVSLKVPFENQLYFAPHLYYSQKGYKVTLTEPATPPSNLAVNNNTTIHTLDAAPMLQYDFSPRPAHFFVRLGPSMEFALAGKEEFDEVSGSRVNRKMTFSFADYGYATASGILHLGYESAGNWYLFGHYAHGIGSANNADYGPDIRHRVIGLSVGTFFGRRAEAQPAPGK